LKRYVYISMAERAPLVQFIVFMLENKPIKFHKK